MAEQNPLPENEDTKTRVTSKITPATPGRQAPQIDLDSSKAPSNTVTGRTLKLQGLAGLGGKKPVPEAAPAAAANDAEDDTRTRRTVKLASLAAGPAVKPLAVKPEASAAVQTVTRRTQKLEALDTQDVIAMSENQTANTAPAAKPVAVAPTPQDLAKTTSLPRQTVKVEGIAPAHVPVIDLNAKPGDTNTRKTVKLTSPGAAAPEIDLNATVEDTKTAKAKKVEIPEANLSAASVDDTVKLQRPAPRPTMPGSVAPVVIPKPAAVPKPTVVAPKPAAAAPVAPAAAAPAAAPVPAAAPGGIKLKKSAPAPKPAVAAPAAAAPAAKAEEPAGNHGKDQTPPSGKSGLKVNTDAIKDLDRASPAAQQSAASVDREALAAAAANRESKGLNVTFAFFAILAIVLMVFVGLTVVSDYVNIWEVNGEDKIEVPIVTEMVQKDLKKVN